MLPPVGRNRTCSWAAAAASGTPSVDPLSARTTSSGRVVAAARESRNPSSAGPGENVTATTRSGAGAADDAGSPTATTLEGARPAACARPGAAVGTVARRDLDPP